MKENNKLEANKLNVANNEKVKDQDLENRLKKLSDEILKIQNSFSKLLVQDNKLKEQLSNIAINNNDKLDGEIWVANKIEEAKQETETIIYEKIKALNYEKTIRDVNESIKSLSKDIKQVDYNKTRALESLEDDLSVKIEDSKVIEDNVLQDKIIDLTEETVEKLAKDMANLEKKVTKDINKLFKKLQLNQETKLSEFEKSVDSKINNIDSLQKDGKFIPKLSKQELLNWDEFSTNKVLNENKNSKELMEVKNDIIDNKKKISKEVSAFEKQISSFQDSLIILKNNVEKVKEISNQNVQALRAELNKNITEVNTKSESKINEAVEKLIERINITKQISEEQQQKLKQILDQKIKESEDKNKELINKKISELNVDKIKENIATLEKLTLSKVNELSSTIGGRLDKIENLKLNKTNNLQLDKLKEELSKLEKITNTKIHELENNVNSKIENLEIEELKEEFSKLETDSNNKIQEIEQILTNKLDEEKVKSEELILKTIDELNIDEVKSDIIQLEELSAKKVKELESNVNSKIEKFEFNELKDKLSELEDDINSKIENLEIEELKEEFSKLETDSNNKVQEIEQVLTNKLEEEKLKNEEAILTTIEQLNIDEIKNSVKQFEELSIERMQELENNKNKLYDTTKSLEAKFQELKELALNTEYSSKAIGKKVNELDSINQKKLDKVKKEQEKFIIQKISEFNIKKEIEGLQKQLTKLTEKLQKTEVVFADAQDKNYKDMQDYVEKRILRMKFATTVQLMSKEISTLEKEVDNLKELQADKTNEELINKNVEVIVDETVGQALSQLAKEQEIFVDEKVNNALLQMAKEQGTTVEKRVNKVLIKMARQQETIIEEKVNDALMQMMKEQKTAVERKVNTVLKQMARQQEAIIEEKVAEALEQISSKQEIDVEQQVKVILKQMAKQQKAKKAQQEAIKARNSLTDDRKKVAYVDEYIRPERRKNTVTPRTNREIVESISKAESRPKRKSPSSLDDMVATLSNSPISRKSSSARNSISAIKRATKKSQLLGYDNYY